MSLLTDNSADLVITSPPYWQLKDYGNCNQIGFNDSYESYINNMNLVWKECLRVLHPVCRLCVNIGDQFARSVYYGRYMDLIFQTQNTPSSKTTIILTLLVKLRGFRIFSRIRTNSTKSIYEIRQSKIRQSKQPSLLSFFEK